MLLSSCPRDGIMEETGRDAARSRRPRKTMPSKPATSPIASGKALRPTLRGPIRDKARHWKSAPALRLWLTAPYPAHILSTALSTTTKALLKPFLPNDCLQNPFLSTVPCNPPKQIFAAFTEGVA